jgi:hypothetical protein
MDRALPVEPQYPDVPVDFEKLFPPKKYGRVASWLRQRTPMQSVVVFAAFEVTAKVAVGVAIYTHAISLGLEFNRYDFVLFATRWGGRIYLLYHLIPNLMKARLPAFAKRWLAKQRQELIQSEFDHRRSARRQRSNKQPSP